MAYTYDNFLSDANAAGMMNQFSEQDLQIARRSPEFGLSLLSLLKDNGSATMAEQKLLATEAANQLRKSYGIGSTGTVAASFANTYGKAGVQPFSYNYEDDPRWSAYKKAYLREGERASENALAQTAAASGGRVSSYAQTAAQQAGNYYAGQLADVIPTLEQEAYTRYLNEFENALKLYQTLGYATPEVAEILGIEAAGGGSAGSGGYGGSGGGNAYTEAKLDEPNGDTGSGDATVDMNSVIQLGYGPVSEDKLAELVASGEVEMYQEGNVIHFKKVEQPQTQNLPGSDLWNFTQNLMNKATGNSSNKNSGNTSSAKKGPIGSGTRAGGGSLRSKMEHALF